MEPSGAQGSVAWQAWEVLPQRDAAAEMMDPHSALLWVQSSVLCLSTPDTSLISFLSTLFGQQDTVGVSSGDGVGASSVLSMKPSLS